METGLSDTSADVLRSGDVKRLTAALARRVTTVAKMKDGDEKSQIIRDIYAHHALLLRHLRYLHQNHRSRAEHHRRDIVHACSLPNLITRPFLTLGPIGSCFLFSIFMRSSTRVLLLGCRVFGAVAVTTFFLSQESVPAATNPLDCKNGPDLGTMFGRLVAVAISSGIFAEFPVIALTHLHRHRFKAVDFDVGTMQWHHQLRRWFVLDIIMWTLGLCYVAFCLLYIMLFIASVAEEHNITWLVSTGMEVVSLI